MEQNSWMELTKLRTRKTQTELIKLAGQKTKTETKNQQQQQNPQKQHKPSLIICQEWH